jgi:inhibitor of cysteine peptidase
MMKKNMLAVIVAVVAVAAVVVTLVLTRASGGDQVTGDTFETSVGKTFTIALDANATTGYSWSQTVGDKTVVSFVSNAYAAETRDPQVVGGGGTDTFTFKAVGKGTTTITLDYARVWESVPPAQTRTITVTVK